MSQLHEDYISKYLDRNKNKSFIGTELNTVLMHKFPTLSINNCRSVLHSAVKKNKIASSKPIKFANNQYAYFSKKTEFGYSVLENSIKSYKKDLHRVVFALMRGNSIITKCEACKISGASLDNHAHCVSYDSLITDLKTLKLIDFTTVEGTEYIYLKDKKPAELQLDKIREKQKVSYLPLYLSLLWLIHTNLVDSMKLSYTGESNDFNGIIRNNEMWDAFGFSNAAGIGSIKNRFQTVVVVDYLPNYCYEEYDFEGYKERVERIVFSTKDKNRKVLPIVFAKDISPRAYSLLKKSGYLFFRLSAFLGESVFDVSRNYVQNVNGIKSKLKNKDYDIYGEVENSLEDFRNSGNEINYQNLKGHLFEYLLYPLIEDIYGQSALIDHSYTGRYSGKDFEADYLVRARDEVVIIELKGYKKGTLILKGTFDQETQEYQRDTIRWFINHTFELCSKSLENKTPKKLCYITTGDFEDSAKKELLVRKRNKPNKLEILYNRDLLIKLLREHKMEKEIKIIEQFYS